MRISFFGYDLGPARNLALVAVAASRRGHSWTFIGNEGLFDRNLFEPRPDVVVTGLSSFKKEEELLTLAYAAGIGVPSVVVCDTHETWRGVDLRVAHQAVSHAVLLVASPQEVAPATAFGYGRVEYLGGPPVWREFLQEGQNPNLPLNTVLVGGVKDPGITNHMLATVIMAGERVFKGGWSLLFKKHPNEPTDAGKLATRAKLLSSVRTVPISDRWTPLELLDFVRLAVFTGGATDSIAAAHKRVAAIYFSTEMVRLRLNAQQGSPDWYPAASGALAVAESSDMEMVMDRLLTREGAQALERRQAEVYPWPAESERPPEERIVELIESLHKS